MRWWSQIDGGQRAPGAGACLADSGSFDGSRYNRLRTGISRAPTRVTPVPQVG